MALVPTTYANTVQPNFVPVGELASSIITGQIAIGATGFLYMETDNTSYAQVNFERNDVGTNYVNLGVHPVITNLVAEKDLAVVNELLKFDNLAVGKLKVAGDTQLGAENVAEIGADTNQTILIDKANISALNAPFASFSTIYTSSIVSETASISSLVVSSIVGGTQYVLPSNINMDTVSADFISSGFVSTNKIIGGSQLQVQPVGSFDYQVNIESENGNTYYEATWHDTGVLQLTHKMRMVSQPEYPGILGARGRLGYFVGGTPCGETIYTSSMTQFDVLGQPCMMLSNATLFANTISTGSLAAGSLAFNNATVPSISTNSISTGSIYCDNLTATTQTFSSATFPTFNAGYISSGTTMTEFLGVIDNISFYNPSSIVAGGWIREDQYGNTRISTVGYTDIWTETRALRLMGATLDGDQSAGRISSFQTNYLSSGTAYISSLVADELIVAIPQLSVPSISTTSLSCATAFVSSLVADNVSSIAAEVVSVVAQNVSSIAAQVGSVLAGTVQANTLSTLALTASTLTLAQGTSTSQMYIGGAVISGTGSIPTVYINNDVSLLQNDLYCQQLRVGYGTTSSQPSEIIMYAPNTSNISFNVANADRTARIQSTVNNVNAGYLLDTQLNPPFFSSIGTTTNMVSYFPSTTSGTIGYSTISVVPQYVGSWYSSNSQAVAGVSTDTPLTYTSQSVNVGGFVYSGSTITVPVGGQYEINTSVQFDTSSGGANIVSFWFLKNGVALPWSASRVSVSGNAEIIGTVSVYDTAVAGDKYAINMNSPDTNMAATAYAASGNIPGVPSIITNIRRM